MEAIDVRLQRLLVALDQEQRRYNAMLMRVLTASVVVLMLACVAVADDPPPGSGDPISLDRPSPSVAGGWNLSSDIYGEAGGPVGAGWDVGGPGPIMHIPCFNYGLQPQDENDAHSLGHNNPEWQPIVYFSATEKSRGRWNTQYRHQANRNQAAGDRFVTNGWLDRSPMQSYFLGVPANLIVWIPGFGPNLLSANQKRYNEIPSIDWWVMNTNPNPSQIDDMDALELHPMDVNGDHRHDQPIFFSLDPVSPSLPAVGSPADIFVAWPGGGGFWQWATCNSMGLHMTDDIDALVVFHISQNETAVPGTDWALFSLKPNNSLGANPGDVYVTCFQGFSKLYFRGTTVGLTIRDDLDALDIEVWDQGVEPQVFDWLEDPPSPTPTPIPPIRPYPDGTPVNTHGIVTLIRSDFLYIEEADRSSGIRVQFSPDLVPWYVELGQDLQVIGVLASLDGERIIKPTEPVSEMSWDNPVPAEFDMKTRDVGGPDLDAVNPGVTDGIGAFNVGLRVRVSGIVTAVDMAGEWFYIWDGANRATMPLDDGSGNLGLRIESGPMGAVLRPWADWVEVLGVASTHVLPVGGRVIPTVIADPAWPVDSFFDITYDLGRINLVGLPAAPANISDGIEHSPKAFDPPEVFANGNSALLDGKCFRWEASTQSLLTYDMWFDDHVMNGMWGPFGGAMLGDGYWLFDMGQPMTYSSLPTYYDRWIAVPRDGWILMGHPKDHNVEWDMASVHDGDQIETLWNASQYNLNWMNSLGYWWDESTMSLVDIGIPDDFPTTTTLYPWHGYWFKFNEGDKSLIIPSMPMFP